jgi:hypothetical protein
MPTVGIIQTIQSRKMQKSKWLQDITTEDSALLDFKIETDYGSRILNNFGTHVQTDIIRVSDFLYLKYGIKWDRLYTSYTSEYNPIWNVDGSITETETRDLASDHTGTDTTGSAGTDTETHTGNETVADSGTDTETHTGTETIADSGTDSESRNGTDRKETSGSVYGFDSSGAVPSDSGSETVTAGIGTSTTYGKKEDTAKDLNDSTTYGKNEESTKNLTDSTTYGRTDTTTHNTKDTDKGTITRQTTRGGNIGVTMTQQMLEADSEYWNKVTSLFYHQVITDVVNEITYKISPVEMY